MNVPRQNTSSTVPLITEAIRMIKNEIHCISLIFGRNEIKNGGNIGIKAINMNKKLVKLLGTRRRITFLIPSSLMKTILKDKINIQ